MAVMDRKALNAAYVAGAGRGVTGLAVNNAGEEKGRSHIGYALPRMLREARERKGVSIVNIAKDTCIRRCFLEALEAGAYERLPERAFALGFVRSYAQALGVNVERAVAAYKAETADMVPEETSAVAQAALNERSSRRRWSFWLSSVIGVFAVTAAWLASPMASGPSPLSDVLEDMAMLAAVQQQTDDVSAAGKAPALFPAAHASPDISASEALFHLSLTAIDDTWLRLTREDGSELWSGILPAGDSFAPHVEELLFLSTTNAGQLHVSVDGVSTGPLGLEGAIVTDMRLDGQGLVGRLGN